MSPPFPRIASAPPHPRLDAVCQKHAKSRYQNEVGRTRIERGLGGPVSNLNGLGGPVLSQTRGHDSHERSTKGRWANQYLSACSARLPTSACSARLPTSACSARPTVPAQHVPQCLFGTPKCLLGEKNSGVWGGTCQHNQAKPCNTMQNQAKSCHAKPCKNRAKRAIPPVRTYMYTLQ